MEQIAWVEDVPKKNYTRAIERVLYEYPFMKLAIEETEDDLPSMTASYDDSPRGGGISKPTEQYGVKRAEKHLKVNRIDKAMTYLSEHEQEMINRKYFDTTQPSDERVFVALRWNHKSYYKIKDRALRKLAIALNII